MHKTTILCQFGLFFVTSLLSHISINSHPFPVGIVSDKQVSSFDSQANQSNQSYIQRELLMPSPEVIDLTLSEDEIQPDPIRSDQGTSMPTRATNQFRTSSSTPPPHLASTELEEFFQSFKVLLQPSNELKIISHSNLSSTTLTLDKHSSTASTTNTGLAYLTSIFVETCINTYTQNGFVTKEFVKIDEDSQTQDYTIIYIRFQGQTPPFSTHNRDTFERLLPTPFPQVGDILSEEEESESEQELIV